jgi:hypothetical protein
VIEVAVVFELFGGKSEIQLLNQPLQEQKGMSHQSLSIWFTAALLQAAG